MKYLKIILFLGILAGIITSFIHINTFNYEKHVEIRDNYVNHPEGLPTPQVAKYTSFGFASLRADLYWLQTIQYIGGNAVSSEYKKYLYIITDLITELNPYFEHPYVIAQLLLPSVNQRYENVSDEEKDRNTQEAIKVSLKGISNFCDSDIIKIIEQEPNLDKIQNLNPCKSYKIPYYLAFIYYHYQNDPLLASEYYKIASANSDSVSGAKSMAAIMAGKGGNREKSIFMFLNIAESLDNEDGVCSKFSQELNEVSTLVFQNKTVPLSSILVQSIEDSRIATFGIFNPDDSSQDMADISCMNYLNKANREINLAYLDQANQVYRKENTGENAKDGQELFDKKYITFLPTDFQQYEKENYGIRYEYNQKLGYFDYSMNY